MFVSVRWYGMDCAHCTACHSCLFIYQCAGMLSYGCAADGYAQSTGLGGCMAASERIFGDGTGNWLLGGSTRLLLCAALLLLRSTYDAQGAKFGRLRCSNLLLVALHNLCFLADTCFKIWSCG